MNLSEIIPPESVVLELEARDSHSAICELLAAMVRAGTLTPECSERALLSLMKREAVASTALGQGVAIPHAKVKFVSRFCGALGVSHGGIDFGAPDGKLVSVVFLFLSPQRSISGHLQLMARIGGIARNQDFTRRIRRSRQLSEVQEVLSQAESLLFKNDERSGT